MKRSRALPPSAHPLPRSASAYPASWTDCQLKSPNHLSPTPQGIHYVVILDQKDSGINYSKLTQIPELHAERHGACATKCRLRWRCAATRRLRRAPRAGRPAECDHPGQHPSAHPSLPQEWQPYSAAVDSSSSPRIALRPWQPKTNYPTTPLPMLKS